MYWATASHIWPEEWTGVWRRQRNQAAKVKESPQSTTICSCSHLNIVDVCAFTQLQIHPIFFLSFIFFEQTCVWKSACTERSRKFLIFPLNFPGKPPSGWTINQHNSKSDKHLGPSNPARSSPLPVLRSCSYSLLCSQFLLIQKSRHLHLNFPWPLTNKGSHTNPKP